MMKNAKHIAGWMLSIPFEEYLRGKNIFLYPETNDITIRGRSYTCTPVLIRVTENMSKKQKQTNLVCIVKEKR